jgi:hypothetical protein
MACRRICSTSAAGRQRQAIRRQTLAIAVRTPRGGLEHQPTTPSCFLGPLGHVIKRGDRATAPLQHIWDF